MKTLGQLNLILIHRFKMDFTTSIVVLHNMAKQKIRSRLARTALLLRTEMSILRVEHISPLFPEVTAALPEAQFSKSGCQMKDMYIIVPLIPCELLSVKWSMV